MASIIQLRRDTTANWASANPILAQGEIGVDLTTHQFKIGDGTTRWNSLSYGGLVGPAQTDVLQSYGSGEDGDITVSSGIVTLTQDMYYNNLTINGTGQINTAGYRIFVKNTLDLSAAPAAAIIRNGNAGANATTQTGGAVGAALTSQTLGAGGAGSAGGTGVVGVGAQAAASAAVAGGNGGASGAGGLGGTGTSGAGGTARTGTTPSGQLDFARFTYDIIRGVTLILGGAGAPGGASGAGDGTVLGRGGGGGGSGAGVMGIWAKRIARSSSTPVGVIQANGGNGGNGATASSGVVGGGAGAGGAGGGQIIIFYEELTGTTATGLLQANGGRGGDGGNGFGVGATGGAGGTGGQSGRIRLFNSKSNTTSVVTPSNGTAGSAASGLSGGGGGAGGISQMNV